jgi:dihydroxyacetone kinase DhaKLM complex PTS-EIIA-like component DhaM
MTTQNNVPATPAYTLDNVLNDARSAGSATAAGIDGIMHLGKVAFGATRAKLITEKTVKDIYIAYLEGVQKGEFGAKVVTTDKAIKSPVSKLRVFVKFAALPGKATANWELIRRIVGIVNHDAAADNGKVGSRYEQVVRVLRVVNKGKTAKVSDKVIRDALAVKEREGDAILRELEAIAKRCRTHAESDQLDATQASFFQAILATADEQVQNYKSVYTPEGDASTDEDEDDFDTSPDADAVSPEDVAEMAAA